LTVFIPPTVFAAARVALAVSRSPRASSAFAAAAFAGGFRSETSCPIRCELSANFRRIDVRLATEFALKPCSTALCAASASWEICVSRARYWEA
jgi:hypothetical protein